MDKKQESQTTDYEVGYRRPPKHTRWDKGESGNPKGRPKTAELDFASCVAKMLDGRITLDNNGKAVRMSKRRALAESMLRDALVDGDSAARRLLIQADNEYQARTVAAYPPVIEVTLVLEEDDPRARTDQFLR